MKHWANACLQSTTAAWSQPSCSSPETGVVYCMSCTVPNTHNTLQQSQQMWKANRVKGQIKQTEESQPHLHTGKTWNHPTQSEMHLKNKGGALQPPPIFFFSLQTPNFPIYRESEVYCRAGEEIKSNALQSKCSWLTLFFSYIICINLQSDVSQNCTDKTRL